MNKDELLKIYSAYLPYDLLFIEGVTNAIYRLKTINKRTDGFVRVEFSNSKIAISDFIEDEDGNKMNFKPIIYDLSYLTKEIEYKGKMIIPMNHFIFKSTQEAFEGLPEFNEHLVNYIKYDDVKQLLEWHFNVFGLPESEYINKATLTNK
ncbi:hypothetical protein [Chryseobacterium sp. 2VB]|uniref:hypothetical protein n=1 Tax=Chryseobacterium sp. 2VB TaxID=2502204 RepID=UPI0010F687EA|nr:hypothetical protein [Chryseobacterium sp. 2VB]